MKRIYLLLFLLVGCQSIDELQPTYDPEAYMLFPDYYPYLAEQDENGYTHVDLDWTGEYLPYFPIDVVADELPDGITSAEFDSDTYWMLGDSLAFTIPLYSPFEGLETYQGTPIPVRDTIIYLNQFEGTVLNIVQDDRIYFSFNALGFASRRIVGPFPPALEGDTINIFMKVTWEEGNSYIQKHYSEKFIVE